jgi:hypothetical protein
LPDHEHDNPASSFHREGSAVVFDKPKSEEEAARQRREDEQHEFARSQVKTNRRLAWFTGALVLATFCTIGVGIWQGTISQKAANAAKSAADTADKTLTELQTNNTASTRFAERRFRIEQRPYLTVTDIKATAPISAGENTVQLGLFNSGRSPALGVRIEPFASIGDKSLIKNTSMRSEFVVGADKPAFNTYTLSITPDDASRIAGGTQLRFKFTVTYADIFQDWHVTRICAYYSPKEPAYKYCENGNSVE